MAAQQGPAEGAAHLLQAERHKALEGSAEGALQNGRSLLGDEEQHAHGVQLVHGRLAGRHLLSPTHCFRRCM